ncbi:perlucin-like [Ylistrum balloti]|uniref:perlucin-like n=1 Tax=Ylistrum balloti TaxID=509963 RepID=UPI002905DDEC|nr:perlucin-like [Ylistrum balloti]
MELFKSFSLAILVGFISGGLFILERKLSFLIVIYEKSTEAHERSMTEAEKLTAAYNQHVTRSNQQNHECPPGWKKHMKRCYFFSRQTGSWAEAGSYCRNFNAKLAEPKDEAEFVFIRNTIKSRIRVNNEYYLGGTDICYEGEWIWASTMEPITNAHWSPGEPNNYFLKENCMTVLLNGLWNDISCETSLPFVCEIA